MLKGNPDKKEAESVAVAIDRDKGSQYALKWTVDHLLTRGQALTLVHVNQRVTSSPKPRKSTLSFPPSHMNDDTKENNIVEC